MTCDIFKEVFFFILGLKVLKEFNWSGTSINLLEVQLFWENSRKNIGQKPSYVRLLAAVPGYFIFLFILFFIFSGYEPERATEIEPKSVPGF